MEYNRGWPALLLISTLEGAPPLSRLSRQGGEFDFLEGAANPGRSLLRARAATQHTTQGISTNPL
jgi:hypothetical protein